MKKLILTLMLITAPVMAQEDMTTSIATNTVLLGAATTTDSTNDSDDWVTDQVTLPDGSKAYLKHKKNSSPQPKSNVIIDRVSRFPNGNGFSGDIYVYPITVKGTPCVVVSVYDNGVAISCSWKQ